jgi:hypothetical protein
MRIEDGNIVSIDPPPRTHLACHGSNGTILNPFVFLNVKCAGVLLLVMPKVNLCKDFQQAGTVQRYFR